MNCVNNILIETTNKLLSFSTSASLDAEVLLSHVLKKDKVWLLTHPNYKLTFWHIIKFNHLINKRINHYPVSYLIGYKEFYGLKFKVNKHTLIPRPESELFIDELIKINPVNKIIVDIGTGSGCLIITAAKLFPNNKFIGIDISKQALLTAKTNSFHHNVKVKFIQNDLINDLNTKLDIIIANLPYLVVEQMDEPSIRHEPTSALFAEDNGLYYYKKLLKQISNLDYQPEYVLLEIDPKQSKSIQKYIKLTLPKYSIKILKDFKRNDRIIRLN